MQAIDQLTGVVEKLSGDVTAMRQQTLLDMCDRPAKKPRLTLKEEDCVKELACFAQFGDYAMVLLPRVIENIWRHYDIDGDDDRQRIMRAAGVYEGLVRGVVMQ